jgi:acetyl-CoA synthetase
MNFAGDVVDRLPPSARALVELARDGSRREWSFGEVSEASARLAGALAARGIHRGDVVMTLVGNRPEWVLSMLACFRIGAVVLPCTEQLRARDLRMRIDATRPSLVIADERNRAELERANPQCEVALIPDEGPAAGEPAPAVELSPDDPCLLTFTSGTAGEPKAVVHAQRYLGGQRVQA